MSKEAFNFRIPGGGKLSQRLFDGGGGGAGGGSGSGGGSMDYSKLTPQEAHQAELSFAVGSALSMHFGERIKMGLPVIHPLKSTDVGEGKIGHSYSWKDEPGVVKRIYVTTPEGEDPTKARYTVEAAAFLVTFDPQVKPIRKIVKEADPQAFDINDPLQREGLRVAVANAYDIAFDFTEYDLKEVVPDEQSVHTPESEQRAPEALGELARWAKSEESHPLKVPSKDEDRAQQQLRENVIRDHEEELALAETPDEKLEVLRDLLGDKHVPPAAD